MHKVKLLLLAGESLENKQKSGRARCVRTERRFAAARAKIAEKTVFSVMRLANVRKASRATRIRLVHEDMGLQSCTKQLKPL